MLVWKFCFRFSWDFRLSLYWQVKLIWLINFEFFFFDQIFTTLLEVIIMFFPRNLFRFSNNQRWRIFFQINFWFSNYQVRRPLCQMYLFFWKIIRVRHQDIFTRIFFIALTDSCDPFHSRFTQHLFSPTIWFLFRQIFQDLRRCVLVDIWANILVSFNLIKERRYLVKFKLRLHY